MDGGAAVAAVMGAAVALGLAEPGTVVVGVELESVGVAVAVSAVTAAVAVIAAGSVGIGKFV